MELSQQEFDNLRDDIRNMCGLVIPEEKRYLIRQRLTPILKANDFESFADLHSRLSIGGAAGLREKVISAITTNETSFFRDGHPFDAFRDLFLPHLDKLLLERRNRFSVPGMAKANILCAGASTGQEPYSLAILINEYAEQNSHRGVVPSDFTILGVDISSAVLAEAAEGKFGELEISRGMPRNWLEKYFEREGEYWRASSRLRDLIKFRQVNLIGPIRALGSFDLVYCRNVLIYFDQRSKMDILRQFRDMMTENAYLVLGASEGIYEQDDLFVASHYENMLLYRPLRNDSHPQPAAQPS